MSEENDQTTSKLKNNIRTLALVLLIFVMPLVSWYYLSSGLTYQKEARAELKDYGRFPAFDFQTQYGTPLSEDSLKAKVSVVYFFSKQDQMTDQTIEKLSLIYDQFKERKDVLFLNFCLDDQLDSNFSFRDYGIDKKMNDKYQCFFLQRNDQTVQQLLMQQIKTPVLPKAQAMDAYELVATQHQPRSSYPFLLLVDEKLQIRNYYEIKSNPSVGRLVEHLAMILPREKSEGTIMVREREK